MYFFTCLLTYFLT